MAKTFERNGDMLKVVESVEPNTYHISLKDLRLEKQKLRERLDEINTIIEQAKALNVPE